MTAFRLLLLAASAVSGCFSAAAADHRVFAFAMRPPVMFEAYVSGVMSPLRSFIRDMPEGSGAVPAEQIAQRERSAERHWVKIVNKAMSADTDGDDRLDRSELSQAGMDTGRINELFRLLGKPQDAALSRQELNVIPEPNVVAARAFLQIGDGDEIRLASLLERSIQAFREVDVDGDLQISVAEYYAAFGEDGTIRGKPLPPRESVETLLLPLLQTFANAPLPRGSLDCSLPRPSQEAYIVVLGVYEGAAVSDVYVGSHERITTTAAVNVEAGNDPLYLIISANDAVIWRFTGATDRIERVVLSGHQGASSGALGVARDKLALADDDGQDSCVPAFHNVSPENVAQVKKTVAAATGRAPDRIAGTYSIAKVSITSMTFAAQTDAPRLALSGFDQDAWLEAIRFAPAGLVNIDAGKVAAFASVAKYKVLPHQFGIAQLLGSGHLQKLKQPDAFRITKPIAYFPAGLAGAHSVKFVLGRGVPMPEGSPEHSCVVSEKTGKQLTPSLICR